MQEYKTREKDVPFQALFSSLVHSRSDDGDNDDGDVGGMVTSSLLGRSPTVKPCSHAA